MMVFCYKLVVVSQNAVGMLSGKQLEASERILCHVKKGLHKDVVQGLRSDGYIRVQALTFDMQQMLC